MEKLFFCIYLLSFFAAHVDVTLAPDQPLPHVYVEDPLILELRSDTDMDVIPSLSIEDSSGQVTAIDLGTVQLRAHGAWWGTIPGAPVQRGRYTAKVQLSGGVEVSDSFVFCRVDRPTVHLALPLEVMGPLSGDHAFEALAAISLNRLRLRADVPDIESAVQAALDARFEISIVLDNGEEGARQASDLGRRFARQVRRWDIPLGNSLVDVKRTLDALRDSGVTGSVALLLRSLDSLPDVLSKGGRALFDEIVLDVNEPIAEAVSTCRTYMQQAGYESISIGLARPVDTGDIPLSGARLVHNIIRNTAAYPRFHTITPGLAYEDGRFGEAYVLLSAYARRLSNAVYLGEVDSGEDTEAHLFRTGAEWCVVAWSHGARGEVQFPVGEANNLLLSDARNNPLPVPIPDTDGMLKVLCGPFPVYLSGEGGDIIRLVATRLARDEAERFLRNDVFRNALPAEIIDIVRSVAERADPRPGAEIPDTSESRARFLGLVRKFAPIEQEWHDGGITAELAVPAMASLSRLVRILSILEEEYGDAFAESYREPLKRATDHESLYLTRTGRPDRSLERGNWLLQETSRLIRESEELASVGRTIEACAVANIAEWRARSLDYAARARSITPPLVLTEEVRIVPDEVVLPDETDEADSPDADLSAEDAETPESDIPETPPDVDEPDIQPEDEPRESGPRKLELRIERGDNPWQISQRYNVSLDDLLEWNGWTRSTTLHVGQRYVVYIEE